MLLFSFYVYVFARYRISCAIIISLHIAYPVADGRELIA